MVEVDSYKERIVNYICGGFNIESLHALFMSDMTEGRVRTMEPALVYDRYAKKGPYSFTIDDYYSVISPHLPCIREGEDSLKVKMRWDQEYFMLRFSGDTMWLSFYQEANRCSFQLMLSCNIDPNEMLYTICDIEKISNDWERQWVRLFEECEKDGRYLEEVRRRMLKVLEKEMRGTYIDYTVKVGPETSKIQVRTFHGQYFVIEVSNYDFEKTLKNIGYFIEHTLLGISAMHPEPQIKIGSEFISGVGIHSLPILPIEQSPYIDVTRYITELTDAVLHHHEEDQRKLLPLANNVLGQVQLVKFAMALRGQEYEILCDETLYDNVSVFFPIRVMRDDDTRSKLFYYPLACLCFFCFFGIDIEVPEEVIRDEWFSSDGMKVVSVQHPDGKTQVLVEFIGTTYVCSIPVEYQGAKIEQAIIAEQDLVSVCDVMTDGVFRLLALPKTDLLELEE